MIDTLISVAILLFAARKMMHMRTMTAVDFAFVSFGFTYGLVPLINTHLGGGLQFPDFVTIQYGVGVFLFIFGMYFVSYFAPFRTLEELSGFVPINTKTLSVIFFVVVTIRLILALEFGSAFAGLSNDVESQTGYFQFFFEFEIIFSCTLWVLLAKCVSGKKSLYLEVLLALESVFVFCKGRRVFFVFFCIFFVFLRFSKRWVNRGLYEYIVVSMAILVFAFVSIVYQPFRMELVRERALHRSPNFLTAAEGTLVADPGELLVEDSKNVRQRDVISAFHKRIIEAQESKGPLFGDALIAALVVVTPRFLYPEKNQMVNSKMTIQTYYGMSKLDTAGSLAAVGQADFGLLGTFIYGCLFALVLKFFEAMSLRFKNSVIGISSLGTLFFMGGNVEEGPEDVFSLIRIFLIFVFLVIFSNIFLRKTSSRD